MALVALRLDHETEYQSKRDSAYGTPEATTFLLGTLSGRVQTRIRDRAVKMRQDPDNETQTVMDFTPNEAAAEYVRFGLRGWRNFKDHAGNEIPFEKVKTVMAGVVLEVVSERCLSLLDATLLQELSEEIRELNTVSEETGKV